MSLMEKRRIRITLAYDGTDFVGWQFQINGTSVQEMVERSLKLLTGEFVRVTGAGRTDSGVHASGQVAHFDTTLLSLPPERFRAAMNTRLPASIRILESREAAPDFHARFDAVERMYRYYLLPLPVVLPFEDRYALQVRGEFPVDRMNRMILPLLGTHDFSTFASGTDRNDSAVRTVTRAVFYPRGRFLVFEIAANSFLWRMVRSIVGTVVDLRSKGLGEEEFARVFEARDRSLSGPTAPAKGLFLEKVTYAE